jgi:hypothetical protein
MATIELRDLNPAEFNNNLIVYGKVAIGTSDLAYNGLQIKPSSGNGQLVVERASGASYQVNAQASLVQIGTISNSPLHLMTNSTSYVYLTTGGRFGIGTDTPNETLEVKSSGTTRIRIDSGDSGASSLDLHDNGSLGARINCDSSKNLELMAGGRTSADLIIATSTGNVGIGTTSPDYTLEVAAGTPEVSLEDTSSSAKFRLKLDGVAASITNHGSNGDLTFVTQGTGDFIFSNGKVGIGTTSPGRLLELSADTNSTVDLFRLTNADSTYSQTVDFSLDTNKDLVIAGSSGNGGIHFNMGSRGYTFSNGNVGIGMTPGSTYGLYVSGKPVKFISDGSASNGAVLELVHANNDSTDVVSTLTFANNVGAVAHIQGGTTDGNTNGYISFLTDNAGTSSEKMRILANGNVGINETTPTEKLHVDGNLKVTGSVIVGSSGATTLSDTGPYDPYVLFKWEGQYYQNGGHNDPPNQYFNTQLYYADATSPWNKSSVATKSCEDLTTLVGTATFNTTYKTSRSWWWHYMLELKGTDRITGSPLPTNYMRIKMPVYYTAGASDHHVFYLKIRMDINSGYQVCVANEAGTPQARAGVATRTAGGANTRGVGAGPRNCNAMQGHRYYGEWTNVLIAKEHINDYSFADTSSPTGRSINLTINATSTQNSTLWFMGIAMGKNKKGVVVNGPRTLYHGMAEGNSNRGQWPDGGGTNRDGLRHHNNWQYSEMAFVYHRYACFTPIQIPSTDKDLIVSVLETGHPDHHVGNTHFFLVDDDGVGVKDGTLADQSQAGRRGYNSLAPNTVYKPSLMNIGSCQNMGRGGFGHYGRDAMTFIIPQSEVARVAGSNSGLKYLKLGMSQVHNHWNHGYFRAIYVEEAS